jgi:hypothetical protein
VKNLFGKYKVRILLKRVLKKYILYWILQVQGGVQCQIVVNAVMNLVVP